MLDLKTLSNEELFDAAIDEEYTSHPQEREVERSEFRAEFVRRLGDRDAAVRELRSILGDGDCAYNEDTKDFIEGALHALGAANQQDQAVVAQRDRAVIRKAIDKLETLAPGLSHSAGNAVGDVIELLESASGDD